MSSFTQIKFKRSEPRGVFVPIDPRKVSVVTCQTSAGTGPGYWISTFHAGKIWRLVVYPTPLLSAAEAADESSTFDMMGPLLCHKTQGRGWMWRSAEKMEQAKVAVLTSSQTAFQLHIYIPSLSHRHPFEIGTGVDPSRSDRILSFGDAKNKC